MPTLAQPLTLAQIRQQTMDLLGSTLAIQSFTMQQIDEAVNWACDELGRTLGMTYVPQTPCFFQEGDTRRPGIPDACIKIVSASLLPSTGITQRVPNGGKSVAILASLNPALYGEVCDVVASDGVASIFMARHHGTFQSGLPKGWVIVKSDALGAAPQIVAGVLGANADYANPPTSDTAYTTPVDGVAGVSTVMDVQSMAVSPDGTSVAWFEGTTNRLRVAHLSGGVWTTTTIAGAYNTYRLDGTGAAAGFSAGLAPSGDPNFSAYNHRYIQNLGFGIVWKDNATILMTETPIFPLNVQFPSRLLEINVTTGVVTTLATETLQHVIPESYPMGVQGNWGGWSFPRLLPGTATINGCSLIINRTFPGFIADTSNLETQVAPVSDKWPDYTALDGMQGPIQSGSPIVNLVLTGQVPSGPGPRPFEAFFGCLGFDVSPKGLVVVVPAGATGKTVTDANGSTVYYPAPSDYTTFNFKAMAVGPDATSFPDHMSSFPNGDWSTPPSAPASYLQSGNWSCWLGGQLVVNITGNLYSCGGA